jgi:lipopolysaccharide export system permease protein
MRLKIIDIYIIKKFLGTFFYSIALLTVIIIIFDVSEKIDDFIENQAPVSKIIFQHYLNFIPMFVNMFSYLFTFIAVIFFTSKLSQDTEIIAILSSGVSFNRLLYPYFVAALLLALMSFYLANFVIPNANIARREFKDRYIENLTKSKDQHIHVQTSPGTFVYVESFSTHNNTGMKFSMEKFDKEKGLVFKLNADRIAYDSLSGQWGITNYYARYMDGDTEQLIKGYKLDTVINLKPADLYFTKEDFEIMDFYEIRDYIEAEKMKGNPRITRHEVEKHQRVAFPFATLVMTLIGVALSSRKVRGGIGLHLGVGIGLAFGFILIMQVSTVFATYGNFPPWLSAWLPNFIFGLIGIYLYFQRSR